jgi:CHAD domain-containing protein
MGTVPTNRPAIDLRGIEKAVRHVRKFIKKDRKRPSGKAVHDLRTGARRLESALNAFAFNKSHKDKKLLDDLVETRKSAGKVRDMDVLTGHALTLDHKEEEQDCLVKLIEYLGAERETVARKLRQTLRRSGGRLSRHLKRAFRRLQKRAEKTEKQEETDRESQAEVAAKALQLFSELGEPRQLNRANLHPYRLKVKELRYVLQMFGRANNGQLLSKLGDVKDAIGEWHDFVELSSIAGEMLDHGSSCKILAQLRSATDDRFERALSLSNQLRHQYMKQSRIRRRGNRRTGPSQLSRSVLAVVSPLRRP